MVPLRKEKEKKIIRIYVALPPSPRFSVSSFSLHLIGVIEAAQAVSDLQGYRVLESFRDLKYGAARE